jgi:hypothetical protein
MIALITKAEPTWRWQSAQWQQFTNIGPDLSWYRTAPQAHPPVNSLIIGS